MRFLGVIFLILMMAACGDKNSDTKTSSSGGEPTQSKSLPENNQLPKNLRKSSADPTFPIEKYVTLNLNDEDRHFAYLWFGLSESKDDEEILKVLVPGYHSENDAFKKKELAAKEKPRVLARIEEYKSIKYIAFELSSYMRLASYDFDRKGFPIANKDCWDLYITTGSNIRLNLRKDNKVACFLPVEDFELAKKIEGLRASNNAQTLSYIYGFIEGTENGGLDITPTMIRVIFKEGFKNNAPVLADLKTR